jgi:hypothetical protein
MEMFKTQQSKDIEGITVKPVHCEVEAGTECLNCESETLGNLCMI